MDIKEKNGIYYVTGIVDETCELESYNLPSGKINFDLSNLKAMNSSGIREWSLGIERLHIIPNYINCPHFFTMLFNITKQLIPEGASVESFQIPTNCVKCNREKVFIMKSGHDYFPGKSFSHEFPLCEFDGGELEAVCDVTSDFVFIERLKN